MSEKARQFRSLLLEPLECRALFSIDGIEVWQFSRQSLNFDLDHFQPAQYRHDDFAIWSGYLHGSSVRNSEHAKDFPDNDFVEKRSPRGHSMHRGRFDNWDAPLPPAESEGPSTESAFVPTQSKPNQHTPLQSKPTQFIIFIDTVPSIPQSHDLTQASVPRSSVDSVNSNRTNNPPTSFDGGSVAFDRAPTAASQNSLAKNSTVRNLSDSTNSTAAPVNRASSTLAPQSFATSPSSGTNTFDFSTLPRSFNEQPALTNSGGQRSDDFRFTNPQTIPSPSDHIFDQAMSEASASVESLESLLSGLAENHRRSRIQSGFDANASSRYEHDWRPNTTSAEVAFAEGGMIALALNRDAALNELEDISDDARSENNAWIANVGIFRAFENGAVAATEYAGVTNRVGKNEGSSTPRSEMTEAESEVADSRLHPLLASTSAALGAVMFGLRRIRKSTPLMFTSRKQR